jgi:hypothetical protein
MRRAERRQKGIGMATVVREIGIDVAAGTCWDAVRDFGALRERLAPGFVTDVQMVGTRERQVTFFTGSVAREYLVGSDDAMMRLAYAVTESPLGSSHMNAAVQVIADGDTRCRFVWITDVLPDELADRVAALMDRGLDAIKTTLESAESLAKRPVRAGRGHRECDTGWRDRPARGDPDLCAQCADAKLQRHFGSAADRVDLAERVRRAVVGFGFDSHTAICGHQMLKVPASL